MRQVASEKEMRAEIERLTLANERLSQENTRLRRQFDVLFAFVGLLSPAGILLEANEAALRAAGIAAEDVLGKPFWDCWWWSHDGTVQDQLENAIQRAAQGETVRYDVMVRMRDGLMPIDFQLAPLRDERGRIAYLVPSAVDVTARDRIEHRLQEREAELGRALARKKLAMDAAHCGTWEWDMASDTVFWSDEMCALFGLEPADFDSTRGGFLSLVLPEDRPRLLRTMEDALAGRKDYEAEYRIRHPDGAIRWFYARGLVNREPDGTPREVTGICIDVTSSRSTADALRSIEQEAKERIGELNSLYEQAPIGLGLFDRDLRVVRINKHLADMNGFPVEAHLGRRIFDLVPDVQEAAEPVLRGVLDSGEAVRDIMLEGETAREPGVRRNWIEQFYPVRDVGGAVIGVGTICQEITEQLRATRALQESEQRFRQAIVTAAVPIMLHAEDDEILAVSEGLLTTTGFTREELKRFPDWLRLAYGDKAQEYAERTAMRFREGLPVPGVEVRVRTRGFGERIWVLNASAPAMLSDGRRYLISIANDITDLREKEGALQESEGRLRQIAETIDQVAWIAEPERRRMLYVSPAYERIWGRPVQDLYDRFDAWGQSIHEADRAKVAEAFAKVMSEGFDVEYRIVRPDGEIRWIADRGRAVRTGPGRRRRAAGVASDITARRRSEEHRELLVRELSHRIKNMLAVVTALARESGRRADNVDEMTEILNGRLGALGAALDLLTYGGWQGARLRDLVRTGLAGYLPERFEVELPEVMFLPEAAQDLALALHELVTNASKYGALSRPAGRVAIKGDIDEGILTLVWAEDGGPPITTEPERGFGTLLIETLLTHRHGGKVTLEWRPSGLACSIVLELTRLSGGKAAGNVRTA
ncbi:MAG: PAS domain S-box protein [Geminicoccaceae bacterium]